MGEHFCLRWNNHQSTVVSVVESLLNSDSLTDCTLAAEGKYLKAHKLILTACSPYFEALLCQHHDKHPIFILKDVKYYELKAMLDYMYKGEVNISQDQLDSFIKTAESLQIKGLTDQGGGGGGTSNSLGGGGINETDSRDVGSTFKRKPPLAVAAARPESPQVGAVPAREGSPTTKRRRRQLPHHADNVLSQRSMEEAPLPPPPAAIPDPTRLAVVPKAEPPDPPSALPAVKSEILEDTGGEEIEDLTLDDDEEDYGGGGEASQPGTSFEGNSQASQDYTQWQMSGDRSATDEVFMAAQEAINSQTNSQGGYGPEGSRFFKRVVESDGGNRYGCLICSYRTFWLSSIKKHVNNVHDPNPMTFDCSLCAYKARDRSNLSAHFKTIHSPAVRLFRCPRCPFSTKFRNSLKVHLISKHSSESLGLLNL